MNILICDDVSKDALRLKNLIEKFYPKAQIVIFHAGADVLEYVIAGAEINICFLDIIMPEMSGVELAEKLRGANYNGEIVFLTSSNDYAHQSYRVKAFDYMIKPPDAPSVQSMMEALEQKIKTVDNRGFVIQFRGGAKLVQYSEISHIEVIDHIVRIRLQNNSEFTVKMSLNEIAKKVFQDRRFAQCHRSFIVNMSLIKTIEGQLITMENGEQVPISKQYIKIKQDLVKWMFIKEKREPDGTDV